MSDGSERLQQQPWQQQQQQKQKQQKEPKHPSSPSPTATSASRRRRRSLALAGVLSLTALSYSFIAESACLRTFQSSSSAQLAESRREVPVNVKCPTQESNGTSMSSSTSQVQQDSLPRTAAAGPPLWADTPSGQICHQMLPWDHDGRYLAYEVAWNALRPATLNATYYPDRLANVPRFRRWVGKLFDYYTFERLRKSRAHPAPRESIQQIWKVIERRIEDPANNGPVRIVFMGGSVTAGRSCDVNPLDLPDTNHRGEMPEWCAYPHRLHVLLNRVLFPGRSPHDRDKYPVFEVTNMAVPGTNSLVGAMAMEYNLVPALERFPPHIVVASYSANDAKDDEDKTFSVNQQDFVHAARRLRPCDDHLPVVVLADDWFSHERDLVDSLANTGSLYKTASWYNLMAIMYTNVVRTTAITHANFSEADGHPLFGSSRANQWHLGMGFHIAQGWTLFFNLLGALHDACSHQPSMPPPLAVPREAAAADDTPQNRSAPELAAELPTKYVGRYADNGNDVLGEWDANMRRERARCAAGPVAAAAAAATSRRPPFATSNCAYAWMVNRMTSVWRGPDIQRALDHVLVGQSGGWVAHHERRKSGWLTKDAHAHFAIEVRNLRMDVDTFTLLSLKSYGPDWIDSRLRVDIHVIPGSARADEAEGEPLQVLVDGYHDRTISVPYPHRFRLPGNGARRGDAVMANFTLMNGTTFKIVGMAFCQSSFADVDEGGEGE